MKPWGYHLIVDGYEPNDAVCDPDKVKKFFDDLIVALDMKSLGPLIAGVVDEPDNKGVSAMQMITTSHIAFHSDEIGDAFYLDVFSCKEFDKSVVTHIVRATFEPEHIETTELVRGVKA